MGETRLDIWIPVIIGVISLAGSWLTAKYGLREHKKTLEVQAKEALHKAQRDLSLATQDQVTAVRELLDIMRDDLDRARTQITALKGRVTRMTRFIRDMVDGAEILVNQLKNLGEDPCWTPPTDAEIEEALDE